MFDRPGLEVGIEIAPAALLRLALIGGVTCGERGTVDRSPSLSLSFSRDGFLAIFSVSRIIKQILVLL